MAMLEQEFMERFNATSEEKKLMASSILMCLPSEQEQISRFVSHFGVLKYFPSMKLRKAAEGILIAHGWKEPEYIKFGMFMFGWMMGIRSERARRRRAAGKV